MHLDYDLTAIIHLLEGEKSAWAHTAELLELMTLQAVSEDVRRQLIDHVRDCRSRSEAIRRAVARMSDQSLIVD